MFLVKFSKLGKIALTLFIGALITIIYYKFLFDIISSVIIYHLFLVGLGMFFLYAFGLLIARLKVKIRYLYSFLWSLFYLLLILVYSLSFAGFKIVGTPITFAIFWSYTKDFTSLVNAINISPILIYGCLLIFLIILQGYFLWQSKNIWSDLESSTAFLRRFLKQKSAKAKRVKIGSIILLISLVALISYQLGIAGLADRLQVGKEPIYAVFASREFSGASLIKHIEPISIRNNYPKNLPFEKKNVILIVVDALRADYLNIYGYREKLSPFLTELKNTGNLTRVDYGFSTSSFSFAGILSILRSKNWPNFAPYTFGIQDLLKDNGYQINFIHSGDHTNFFILKEAFGKSIDFYYDGFLAKNFYQNDDRLIFEGLNKVAINKDPYFFYFHLMSVHGLGNRLKENVIYQPANALRTNAVAYRNNYKNGIIQADKNIRKIFHTLEKKGILRNSIVFITADHGESLGEDHYFSHANTVNNREILIPILIYDTDHTKKYNSDHAIQADIAPTIVDRLGLPIPSSWEGESLLRPHKKPYSFHCFENYYAILHYQNGIITKYCYNKKTKAEQVFDVKSDVREKKNLLATFDQTELTTFRKMMKKFVRETE